MPHVNVDVVATGPAAKQLRTHGLRREAGPVWSGTLDIEALVDLEALCKRERWPITVQQPRQAQRSSD